ncbi:IclR family transcriptional regulator [Hyphomicrobiales bacterium]|nr:IclR family transcriptional regulator [Hyphomicrobiales bacterium]CAH1693594.1 IclR family transcriptional regulator [Hyphomicrobiales bacterium]
MSSFRRQTAKASKMAKTIGMVAKDAVTMKRTRPASGPFDADEKAASGDPKHHQNIERMTLVLDVLAEAAAEGARLVDVVRRTGLSKTVTHRCLAGLTAQGLAAFDGDSARFFLGDRILAWSTAASARFELAQRVKPYAQRVADETEDTVYFMVRRGDEAVCFARAEGSYPIKTLTLSVGERRLLGTNTGGIAILAFLGDDEIDRIITTHRARFSTLQIDGESLRELMLTAQASGYSAIDGQVMPGMSGIGVPIYGKHGKPVAALSVAAVSPRLQGERRSAIVARLKTEATRLEKELLPFLL